MGCINAPAISFGYAGSAAPGGPAADLVCSGSCIETTEIDNGAVTLAKLASCPANQILRVNGSGAWTCTGALTVLDNGNVGIGTTTPNTALEVNGALRATSLQVPGTVANVVTVQTRAQGTYTAPITGDGTAVTPLNLAFTPKKAGNKVILEWVVNGEMVHNTVYIVTRNDVRLANTTDAANNRWAGVTAEPYDSDNASTPDNAVVKIIDENSLGVATTYKLQVRSSDANARTLYLNRCINSAGQDSYEAGLSVATAMEIWQ